ARAQARARARVFWQTSLKGVTSATPLPGEHGRARRRGRHAFGQRRMRLPAELTASLTDLVRKERLTLSGLVQGVWALLLARYQGLQDVVFGAVVSGRPPA